MTSVLRDFTVVTVVRTPPGEIPLAMMAMGMVFRLAALRAAGALL